MIVDKVVPGVNVSEIFRAVDTILVIDWPHKEVPEMLALAGFHVVVRGGPGPEDYSVYEVNGDRVVARHVGRPPERVDLIYAYRPVSELPAIIAAAKNLHAKTIWTQSGLSAAGVNDPKGYWVSQDQLRWAGNLAQAAGLNYITDPYIGDAAREILASRRASGA